MPITAALGHNRTNNVFSVGENLELHVVYSAGATHSWELTKNGKPAKPDETERVGTASPFVLKFKFKDGKTSDTGIYKFTLSDAGKKLESVHESVCKNSMPVIKPPTKTPILDTAKPVELKVSVKGVVDAYNWLALLPNDDFVDLRERTSDSNVETKKKCTVTNTAGLNGAVAVCQVANFYDGAAWDKFADACVVLGVFGKPSKIKVRDKIPSRLQLNTANPSLAFSLKIDYSPTASTGPIDVLLVKNNEDFIGMAFDNPTLNTDGTGNYWASFDVGSLLATDFGKGVSRIETFAIFRATGEVVSVGSADLDSSPAMTLSASPLHFFNPSMYGPNPLMNLKLGEQFRSSVATLSGTKPITVNWFITKDHYRSWQKIGEGESFTYTPGQTDPLNGNCIRAVATNKYGESLPCDQTIFVNGTPIGAPKRAGMK